jgi:hypothetical protein
MDTQTYANHRHTPRLTGIGFLFVAVAFVALSVAAFGMMGEIMIGVTLAALIGAATVLLLSSRTYTTRLQDRIIRLEMAMRCAQLLPAAQQRALSRLSMPHIVALRFASDEELPLLIERTEREQLTPDQIKRAIKNWVPDLLRT